MDAQHKHIKIIKQFHDKKRNLRVLAKCLKCGYIWTPLKGNMSKKHRARGCPNCAHHIPWTPTRIKQRINKVSHNTIKVYFNHAIKDEKSHVLAKCLNCGYEWRAIVADLIRGTGCPNCAHCIPWTPARAKKQIKHIFNRRYIIKMPHGLPNGKNTRVIAYCPRHHYTWHPVLESLLQGYGCRRCADEEERKNRNGVGKKHFFKWYKSQNKMIIPHLHKFLLTYKNLHQTVRCVCLKCGFVWLPTLENLMNHEGCPYCNKLTSHGEAHTGKYLRKLGLKPSYDINHAPANMHYVHGYHLHTCKDARYRLHADFLINIHNQLTVIEFDGVQHFKPVQFKGCTTWNVAVENYHMGQKRDIRKNKYCTQNNIRMIRIKNKTNITSYDGLKSLVVKTLNAKLRMPKVHQMSLF